jgi:molybdopterin molybdotransferase
MLELEAALAQILAALPPPAGERIPLRDAHGRVLTEPISAPIDLPVFDNSSMDGYAVRAADTAAATTNHPARLRLLGRSAAGAGFRGEVSARTCVRVFTGSPLPRGADAVVMQEDARAGTEPPGEVSILEPARPWANVRFRGEDVKRGAMVPPPFYAGGG